MDAEHDQHPGHDQGPEHPVHLERRVSDVVAALERACGLLPPDGAGPDAAGPTPAWRRPTRGEHRLPVTVAILGMVGLQAAVPDRLAPLDRWWLPAIEVAILVALVAANPGRISSASRRLRLLGLTLIALASAANGWSVIRLVVGLVDGTEGGAAGPLLATGANIWLTNIVIFGLWYWELDRGGPVSRAHARDNEPDFLFPEMTAPQLAAPDWEPTFVDYLYVAFTNATAFSPTDTLPFSRWSKLTMMLQATISLVTAALVIARAVNILH